MLAAVTFNASRSHPKFFDINAYRFIHLRAADVFARSVFGGPDGAMDVEIKRSDTNKTLVRWSLFAADGYGPYIPCAPSVLIAYKLLTQSQDSSLVPGARPCIGFFSLKETETNPNPNANPCPGQSMSTS